MTILRDFVCISCEFFLTRWDDGSKLDFPTLRGRLWDLLQRERLHWRHRPWRRPLAQFDLLNQSATSPHSKSCRNISELSLSDVYSSISQAQEEIREAHQGPPQTPRPPHRQPAAVWSQEDPTIPHRWRIKMTSRRKEKVKRKGRGNRTSGLTASALDQRPPPSSLVSRCDIS